MFKWSYSIINRKIKEIRGFTLEDDPCNFYEMMQAFDTMQKTKVYGLEIAQELIDKTKMWLNVIQGIGGIDCPKYIVASNKIALNCLQILCEMVESVYTKASVDDLEPQIRQDLSSRVIGVRNILNRIGRLYMTPETLKIYKGMLSKLAFTEELLNVGVAIS